LTHALIWLTTKFLGYLSAGLLSSAATSQNLFIPTAHYAMAIISAIFPSLLIGVDFGKRATPRLYGSIMYAFCQRAGLRLFKVAQYGDGGDVKLDLGQTG
jgi:hypothetical protein